MKKINAKRFLKKDPLLGNIIERIDEIKRNENSSIGSEPRPPLQALIRAIIGQQLSGAAARTIFTRFIKLFPRKAITPGKVLMISSRKFHGIGISKEKTKFIKNLCSAIEKGDLNLATLNSLPDQEVSEVLQKINGIGRWTAEMYLIFHMQRQDVLPCFDIGIQRGIQIAYSLKKKPTPKQVENIGSKWKPHRTLASRYLWEAVNYGLRPE